MSVAELPGMVSQTSPVTTSPLHRIARTNCPRRPRSLTLVRCRLLMSVRNAVGAAWLAFGQDPRAWFLVPHGEVLARA